MSDYKSIIIELSKIFIHDLKFTVKDSSEFLGFTN